jgi:hypothetical protein
VNSAVVIVAAVIGGVCTQVPWRQVSCARAAGPPLLAQMSAVGSR